MRESIGNTFVFNTVIVFVAILISLLIGSFSYSKAFKVKNRIISIIEKHENYDNGATNEIEKALSSIGYRINVNGIQNCPTRNDGMTIAINQTNSDYRYCVYEYNTKKGVYYGVIAYMYFDIPIIGELLEFPVYGETKIIYNI